MLQLNHFGTEYNDPTQHIYKEHITDVTFYITQCKLHHVNGIGICTNALITTTQISFLGPYCVRLLWGIKMVESVQGRRLQKLQTAGRKPLGQPTPPSM